MEQMKKQDVYEELSTDTLDQETLDEAIKTPTEVRSRIVGKG